MPKFEPFVYQQECLEAIHQAREGGASHALIIMASGLGKTVTAALDTRQQIEDQLGRVLYLCHQNDILTQAKETFAAVLGGERTYGFLTGLRKDLHQVDVLFSSFPTMRGYLDRFDSTEFDYIIVDESHRTPAPTRQEVVSYFRPRFLLGMTATPDRLDQQDIRSVYGAEVYSLPLAEAIVRGFLTPVDYRLLVDRLLLEGGAETPNGRLHISQLNRRLLVPQRDEEVAKIVFRFAEQIGDPRIIVFCPNIAHCERMAAVLTSGVTIHSKLPQRERDVRTELFRQGMVNTVITVDCFNEGIDIPEANLIVFLRSTASSTIFLQQLGRGLRRAEGKDKVMVLDFVANCDRIKMVHNLDRSLDEAHERLRGSNPLDFQKQVPPFVLRVENIAFDEKVVSIVDIIDRIRPTLISNVATLVVEYMPPPRNRLPADQVTARTHSMLWWKCCKPECGYEWQATGNARMNGTGCPACCNKVVTDRNSLAVICPDLAKEYMPPPKNEKSASEIFAGRCLKVWWKCSICEHEWQASPANRRKGTGCPACYNFAVTSTNNLAATHPHLAREYMPPPKNDKSADQVVRGSSVKVWWKCSTCGHEWQASLCSRSRKRPAGCPGCSGRVATETNNILIVAPDLAREYMPPPKNNKSADQVAPGTAEVLWWKCSTCGHEWQARGYNRVRKGTGCPACTRKLRITINDALAAHPHLAREYMPPPKNDKSADQLVPRTAMVWWKCSVYGHEWQARVSDRLKADGCPVCTHRLLTGENHLAATHPHLAREYMPPPKNDKSADQVAAGTGARLWWKCSICGHEWQAPGSRRIAGIGCPACSGFTVTPDNNLATKCPHLAREYMPPPKNDKSASAVFAGGATKRWWKCSACEHEWQARIISRVRGSGCPACAGKAVNAFNGLQRYSDLACEYMPPPKNDLPAEQIIAGTEKKLWWRCSECGFEWQATGRSRVAGSQCPSCCQKREQRYRA